MEGHLFLTNIKSNFAFNYSTRKSIVNCYILKINPPFNIKFQLKVGVCCFLHQLF